MIPMVIPTRAMTDADAMPGSGRVSEMADAFHPSQFLTGTGSIRTAWHDDVFDAAEAALLWAAGRITLNDFMAVFDDHDPGRAAR